MIDVLIVRYGWGMYGDQSELRANPPDNVNDFVDAMFAINGKDDLGFVSGKDRRLLTEVVIDWVFDPNGPGARSGLPLC